jgi:hypothetical protein
MVYTLASRAGTGQLRPVAFLFSQFFRDRFAASAKAVFDQALLRHPNPEFIPQAGGQPVKILDAFETERPRSPSTTETFGARQSRRTLRDLSRRKITDVLPHQRECELI